VITPPIAKKPSQQPFPKWEFELTTLSRDGLIQFFLKKELEATPPSREAPANRKAH